jgi:hypothetical protein
MAAPDHPNAIYKDVYPWIRRASGEPETSPKYSDALLQDYLEEGMAQLIQDAYACGDMPPVVRWTLTPVSGQAYYKLPPDCMELLRVSEVDSTTGIELIRYDSRDVRSRYGTGPIRESEGFLYISPYPQSTSDLQIMYIPGGDLRMHQNVAAIKSGDNDSGAELFTSTTCYLEPQSTAWMLGTYDKRPNAFIGSRIRFLGTPDNVAPSGYAYFPVMERVITDYDYTTKQVTWAPPLEYVPGVTAALVDKESLIGGETGRTYVVYEIVPNLHKHTIRTISQLAALAIMEENQRTSRIKSIVPRIERNKHAVFNRWSTMSMRDKHGSPYTEEFDAWEETVL